MILEKNKKVMVGLIISQLMSGLDAEGQQLRPYQDAEYAKMKLRLNPRGVTDLRLTGKFHRGIFASISGLSVSFGSTDVKTEKLKADYGNILNLTEESKQILVKEHFQPETIRWYKKLYKFR